MPHKWMLLNTLGGLLLLSSCTIRQQQDVLGAIGTVIPGSSTSRIPSLASSSNAAPAASGSPAAATSSPSPATTAAATPPPAAQTVEVGRTDAQWVLQTLQNAMGNDPAPFQDCLDNTPCKTALTAHLIQLQKRAGGTIELPALYDRYDLKRGKE